MIYLTPTPKPESFQELVKSPYFGIMATFGCGRSKTQFDAGVTFGVDNACFSQAKKFSLEKYLKYLEKLKPYADNCLFAPAPDVVGDAKATWEKSKDVLPVIREIGLPAALVAQDGLETLSIRWEAFDALFIGGTTEWKLSEYVFTLISEAKERNKHVHIGRVNSRMRLRLFAQAGADSADGTHLVFKPDERLDQLQRWMQEIHERPFLIGAF